MAGERAMGGRRAGLLVRGGALALMLVGAQVSQALDLERYRWQYRLLVIFETSLPSSELDRARAAIRANQSALDERDMLVIAVEPGQQSALRDSFAVPDDKLAFVLVGKDGGAKTMQAGELDLPAMLALIDTMPMRKREMRERR